MLLSADDMTIEYIDDLPIIWSGKDDAPTLIILAHGAGAAMDTDFMNYFAESLASKRVRILRFEFPYMALRRQGHGRRPPNTQKILLSSWQKIIEYARGLHKGKIYIGGKSMGGRMASMIADGENVAGLICLGYPFYAPGKMDKPRIDHLENLKTDTLMLQGERDVMGSKDVVESYKLSSKIKIKWLPDGDHGLKPRKKSGFTEEGNLGSAITEIMKFI